MTKERKSCVYMWRAISQGILTGRVRCVRDVIMYQRMWGELHSHTWFRHCWLCQYVSAHDCAKCPMYAKYGEDCRNVSFRAVSSNPCRLLRNDGNDYDDVRKYAMLANDIADFLEFGK